MATWTNQPAPTATPAGAPQIAPAAPPPARTWIGRVLHQLLVDTTYTLLIGLPLAIISFSLMITGVVLSAGLLVTTLGIPVLAGTLLMARGLADLHRVSLGNVAAPADTAPALPEVRSRAAAGAGSSRRSATRSPGSISWPGSSICRSRSSRSW